MTLEFTIIEVFGERPLQGNTAAVAILDRFPADDTMQAIATELNVSETAFVVPRPDGEHDLRWFTPYLEDDLFGHAALAAAAALGGTASFHTASGGRLACRAGEAGFVEIDFPLDPPAACPAPARLRVAGLSYYGRGRCDALAVLEDAAALRSLYPDPMVLAGIDARAVVFCAPGDRDGIDFLVRTFAPIVAPARDRHGGSAYCVTGSYWSDRLGRDDLVGEVASMNERCFHLRVTGEHLVLGGHAGTVAEIRILC